MTTPRPQLDPVTGDPIQPSKTPIDPNTGEPVQKSSPLSPMQVTPKTAQDLFNAGIHSKMLGVTPGVAYENRDAIDKELRSRGGNYDDGKLDDTIYNDIKVGLEGSVSGLLKRNKLAEEVSNPGMVDRFMQGVGQLIGDAPWMLAGGVSGGAAGGVAGSEVPVIGNITLGAIGAGAGAFGVPAAMREALVLGIKNGKVESMSDLLRRSANVVWAGAKGAITGAIFELAGGIPVGKVIGGIPVAALATKAVYQATAMTTAADLLEGHAPNAKDFAGNAALIVPLALITHGLPLGKGEAEQATMDRYVADGTHPAEQHEQLTAQPPMKPDMPDGLRPAIQVGEGVTEGDTTDSHATLSERVLAKKPVEMEQLEADPDLADKVLENPKIHEQDVIDRAWEIKKEAVEAGDVETPEGEEKPQRIEDIYNRAENKSGRGFVTPDGKFLSRMEARAWVKDNEPAVHAMWADGVTGDKAAELHSEDYAEARRRVGALNLVDGDPVAKALDPDTRRFLAEARSKTGILNKIKAGLASKGYGYEAIRTLLTGPRNMLRAEGEQIVSGLRKLLPDEVDQQALHFARDYRGEPDKLRTDIEEVRSGTNEKLKAFIPAMERALEPMTPAMQQADAQMTAYFQKALDLGRAVGTLESGIDPSRYSPRMFMKATEGGTDNALGRPMFTDFTTNSIRRDYLHTLDPLKSGETEARTFNALDEMSIYSDRHAVSVSTALFKNELKNSALGVEGSRDKVPDGWVALSHQFEDRRTIVQEDGSTVTTVKNLYVPKDVAAALKPLLEAPGQLSQLASFLHVQSVIKAMELSLSAFHIKALNVTAFNNLGLKDFATAAFKDINAPDTLEIERRGALYGLTTTKTGVPVDSYMNIKSDVEPTGLAKLADNAIVNKVSATAQAISKYTFDTVQRKWKVMDFAKKEAGWVASHPDATESQYAEAMRGYAKEINSAYGGLNWDVMGVSKGTQNVSRLILLAPDWTFSNVANLKYALTDGGTAGAASRSFFLKSFMTGFASTAAASIYFGGKYDPSDAKHLDQVYLGTDKDGKEMYANWFFAGAPKDAMNLYKRSYSDGPIAGLAEVIVSKASPVAGTLIDVSKNKDYKGAAIYKRTDDVGKQTLDTGKYAGEKLLPITGVSAVQTVMNALKDPTHEYTYGDLLSLAADAIGSPTVHSGGESTTSTTSPSKRFESAGRRTKRFTIKGQ